MGTSAARGVLASFLCLIASSAAAETRPPQQRMPSTGDHYVHAERRAGEIKVGFSQVARWRSLARRSPGALCSTQRCQLAGTLRAIRRTVRRAGGHTSGPPTTAKGAFVIRYSPRGGAKRGQVDATAQEILAALAREKLYDPKRARLVNYRNERIVAQGIINIGVSGALGLAVAPACEPLGKLAGRAAKELGGKTAKKAVRRGVEMVLPRLGTKLPMMAVPRIAPRDVREGDWTGVKKALEVVDWVL